jgi:disulfide oxidoreductase YuzD
MKRKKEKEEHFAKIKAEREAAGLELTDQDKKILDESEPEEIDYTVVMQEEETVPEGEAPLKEENRNFEGRQMRQIIRG